MKSHWEDYFNRNVVPFKVGELMVTVTLPALHVERKMHCI